MKLLTVLASATFLSLAALPAVAQAPSTLRIGLQEDPDMLDPHKARTFVGRIESHHLLSAIRWAPARSSRVRTGAVCARSCYPDRRDARRPVGSDERDTAGALIRQRSACGLPVGARRH